MSKNWVRRVMTTSDALHIPRGLFTRSPVEVAKGLAESARHRFDKSYHVPAPGLKASTAKTEYQAAMSMLNFYINRAGKRQTPERRAALMLAKEYLRREFGRETQQNFAGYYRVTNNNIEAGPYLAGLAKKDGSSPVVFLRDYPEGGRLAAV